MVTDSLKGTIVHGAIWSLGGRFVAIACNFVLTVVLARGLAPSDYGAYFIATTTIVLVSGVGALGMDEIVVRFTAIRVSENDSTGVGQVIWRCLGIVVTGTLINCVGFWLIAPAFFTFALKMHDLADYIVILTLWLFFAALQRQLSETFRGLSDIRLATLFGGIRNIGILNAVVTCAATFVLWTFDNLSLFTALLVMLCTSVLIVSVSGIVLLNHLDGTSRKSKTDTYSKFGFWFALQEGWLIWLGALLLMLNGSIGAWLAGAFDTAAHVALFGAAAKFALLLATPATIVGAVLPPIVAELHAAGNMERLARVVRSVVGVVLVPCFALLLIVIFLGNPLLRILLGTYYAGAYPLLVLLSVAQIINVAAGAWVFVSIMTGGKRELAFGSTGAVILQLIVTIPLGLNFGVLGVAIGVCASLVISNIFGTVLVWRRLRIWTFAMPRWADLMEVSRVIFRRLGRNTILQE